MSTNEIWKVDRITAKDLLKKIEKSNSLANPFQDGIPQGPRFDFLNYKQGEDQRPVRIWLNNFEMELLRKMEATTGIDIWQVFRDAIHEYYNIRL